TPRRLARARRRSRRVALTQLHGATDLELEPPPSHRTDLHVRALLLQPLPQEDEPRLEVVPELGQAQGVVQPKLPVAECGPSVLAVRPEQLPEDLRRDVPDEVLAVDEDAVVVAEQLEDPRTASGLGSRRGIEPPRHGLCLVVRAGGAIDS